jgi:hypothetical protein
MLTLLMARPVLSVAVPEIVPPATCAWRFAVEEQITAKTKRPAPSTFKVEVHIMGGSLLCAQSLTHEQEFKTH